MPPHHLILCCSLLLLSSIFPSIRVFSNESALHIRWPKYSFSFNISPSSEHSGLISFRMDWLDLLAVQGTLQESSPTPQFKSINSSALSFLYSPILTSVHDYWKNHSLTRQTFVAKVMPLLFNMLSRFCKGRYKTRYGSHSETYMFRKRRGIFLVVPDSKNSYSCPIFWLNFARSLMGGSKKVSRTNNVGRWENFLISLFKPLSLNESGSDLEQLCSEVLL